MLRFAKGFDNRMFPLANAVLFFGEAWKAQSAVDRAYRSLKPKKKKRSKRRKK